ncbi:hypothetical protein [Emticicia sp. 17c]|uniref:hypothetical protein n=1 Tax=Emticicia sp. 17c TaxID=3127704 RepID=UPI00301B74E4
MSNKLNLSAVERYSKAYAARVCDDFFAHNNAISGKQILSLCNVQQVNLLTIRALYEKWQGDTQRLRSPYFDFANPEVQQALKSFMNVVSQFISVKREHFEPLLIDAVGETLVLILEPQTFYKELMRDLPNFRFTQENVAPLSKYIQINKQVIPNLVEKLNGKEFVFANQAMTWIEEMPITAENPDKYLSLFAEKVSIPEELMPTRAVPVADVLNSASSASFFDLELNRPREERAYTPPPVTPPQNRVPEVPAYVEPPKPEPIREAVIESRPAYEYKPEPVAQKVSEPVYEKTATKEAEELRLNEKLASEHKSLNDQAKASRTILDHHQHNRIEGITGAISLNQRFLFTNNLFGGNIQAFSHALDEIELCKDFSEAKELILKKYVPRYMWDITGAEAEEFIEIVKRRFN